MAVRPKDQEKYRNNPLFRSTAESAMRAIKKCSPFRGLPPEKYEGWKDIEFTFDSTMLPGTSYSPPPTDPEAELRRSMNVPEIR